MLTELLKRYIFEVMMSPGEEPMTQNVIRKDPEGTGELIIRKLVTYTKPLTKYRPGEDVDSELTADGNVKVDDLETWHPDFDKSIRKVRHNSVNKRKSVKLA